MLLHLGALAPLFGIISTVNAVPPNLQQVVDTGYAKYLGGLTAPYSVGYLGVPYAEPPLGDLRFRAPVPLNTQKLMANKTIVDATKYPDFCVQGTIGQGDAGGAGSEDCLKLNIYAPVNATAESKRD